MNGSSGSQVRPKKMIQAFEESGFEVLLVTGDSQQRKKMISEVINSSKASDYKFIYSENHTLPLFLTDPDHVPRNILADYKLFIWAKRHKIPIGLFYRDIYWRLKEKVNTRRWLSDSVKLPFFILELIIYKLFVDHYFLPAIDMNRYFPLKIPIDRSSELPPGCDRKISHPKDKSNWTVNRKILLIYVGGISPPIYDISKTIQVMTKLPEIRLTIICRPDEWELHKSYYLKELPTNIEVVHASGLGLKKYLEEADGMLLYRAPTEFSKLAMPIKIFEALQEGLPVITNKYTNAGDFVEKNKIGWTVNSDDKLLELLRYLVQKPDVLTEMRSRILAIAESHTWCARALTVRRILLNEPLDSNENRKMV